MGLVSKQDHNTVVSRARAQTKPKVNLFGTSTCIKVKSQEFLRHYPTLLGVGPMCIIPGLGYAFLLAKSDVEPIC